MTPALTRYLELEREAIAEPNEVVRDRRIDEMDELWPSLTAEEQEQLRASDRGRP